MKLELKFIDHRICTAELMPSYATPGACALDMRACTLDPLGTPKAITEKINLYPGHKVKIGAGFAVHLDDGGDGELYKNVKVAGLLLPRSGLGSLGIRLSNTVGLIDQDFQGHITMAIENQGNDVFIVEPLARLAQMMIIPCFTPEFVMVEQFTQATERGAGGFNSTGTN